MSLDACEKSKVSPTGQAERRSADEPWLLQSFLRDAPVAVAMFDRQMCCLGASERWRIEHGLDGAHILGASYYEWFPDCPPHWRSAHQRALAGEAHKSDGENFQNADGSQRWMRWAVRPWRDPGGAIGGVVIFAEDVTERKRAEARVHLSEQRYRLLLDHSTDAIFVHDEGGRFLEVNQRACASVGYSRDELLAMSVADLEQDYDLLRVQAMWSMYGPGTGAMVHGHHRRKDGSVFPVEVRFTVVDFNGQRLLIGAVRDVTEREVADQAVRETAERLQTALEAAQAGTWEWNVQTRVSRWSDEVFRLYGLDPARDQASYEAWLAAVHPDDRAEAAAVIDAALRDRAVVSLECRVCVGDAPPRWVYARGTPELGPDGAPVRYRGIVMDITQRKLAEQALRESQGRYRTIFQTSPDAITLNRLSDGLYQDVNEGFCRIFGWPREQVIGHTSLEIGIWSDPADRVRFIEAMQRDGSCSNFEATMLTQGGERRTVLVSSCVVILAGGLSMLSVTRDVSERARAQDQLRKLSQALEQSPEGIVITNLAAEIEYVNAAFSRMSGFSSADVMGKPPEFLTPGKRGVQAIAQLRESMRRGATWQGELQNRRKDGTEYTGYTTVAPIRGDDGAVTNYVAMQQDISDRVQAERRIQQLAFYDQLTGLPNRTLLFDRLKQAATACARLGAHGVLMMIDLDHFKLLNDTQGHDVGDQLLKQVAVRVGACIRRGDTLARLGGDEFMLVMAGLSGNAREAATYAEGVARKILAALQHDFDLGGVAHHCSASIGVTLFNNDALSNDELMKQSDLAMYKAKDSGRDSVRFFDPLMESAVKQRSALEKELRRALEEHQFLLHYQPQVDAAGRTFGVEALVRWEHPGRGLVSPAEFIPVAEESGLILPLGREIFAIALAQMAAWARQPAMAGLTVAVNTSARQFRQPDFVEQVLGLLQQAGVSPARLKLELTESLLIDNAEDIIEKMATLKSHGVGFALDDFGTGFSSLTYLKRLPLDQLKIDQSFVRDVLTDPNDAAIARTIIALAESLGLGVIAEGVETAPQQAFLADAGCLAYQGYFFSRPLAPAALEDFLLGRRPAA